MLGLLLSNGDKTLSNIYLTSVIYFNIGYLRYWSIPKFFSRSNWSVLSIIQLFLDFLMSLFPDGLLIVDYTHNTTQGRKQQARHFRKNPHYKKGYQNQSKFLAGSSALSIAFIFLVYTPSGLKRYTVPLGSILVKPGSSTISEEKIVLKAISQINKGKPTTFIADKGFSDSNIINRIIKMKHTLS